MFMIFMSQYLHSFGKTNWFNYVFHTFSSRATFVILYEVFSEVTLPQSLTFLIIFNHTSWKVSKYGVFLVCIFPFSDWIRTRKNSVFEHFSRSVNHIVWLFFLLELTGLDKNVTLRQCESLNNPLMEVVQGRKSIVWLKFMCWDYERLRSG